MHDDIDLEKLSNSQLYKKLLGKTPFVKSWMEPYLPDDVVLRDMVVMTIASLFGFFVTAGSYFFLSIWLGEEPAFLISLIPMGLSLWFGNGAIFSRYTVATVKLQLIKNRRKKL
ncbi:MAG: hypothetical protein ABI230_12890 [Aestuariivirga sp.]